MTRCHVQANWPPEYADERPGSAPGLAVNVRGRSGDPGSPAAPPPDGRAPRRRVIQRPVGDSRNVIRRYIESTSLDNPHLP